ncbi:hypothetical protein V496_00860 [Pseudogymnoascus sp. VKM F-4515 (FW-2607)]|nr:hypothetical protein V496_00860 [Pseudogymnoascus sp. VKM F-4515 (FW-2607)]
MWVSASNQNANTHDHTDRRIGYQSVGNVYKGLAEKVVSSLESRLPKPPCNWVGGPKKRTHQSTSSKAKRPRFGANVNASQGESPDGNAFEAGTGTESQATGCNHYSMRILLTAAEQIARQIPNLQYPSAESSSIVNQSCPTSPEPRILLNESALCGARWNFPSHRDPPSNEVAPGSDSETGDSSIDSLHSCEADGDVHKSSAQSSTPLHMSQPRSHCESLPKSQGGTAIGHLRLAESSQISRPPNEKQNAVLDTELFVPFDLETCFDAYGYGQLVDVVDCYDFFNPTFK